VQILFIGILILGLIYLCYALLCIYLWHTNSQQQEEPPSTQLDLSVIIIARNEAENIRTTLESIRVSNYPEDRYEVILMDDHSEDKTIEIAESLDWDNLRVLSLKNYDLLTLGYAHKRAALYYAVAEARMPYILQMDADCICLQSHLQHADVVVGPIDISRADQTFLELWQTYESIGTMVSTFIGHHLGLWFSGASANMAYSKKVYEVYMSGHQHDLASGDDIFMIQDAIKRKKRVSFVRDNRALVTTKPVQTLKDLYQQRLRWASKTKYYTSTGLKLFMTFMAAFHLLLIVGSIVAIVFWSSSFVYLLLLALLCKWLGDWIILGGTASFYGHVYHILLSPFMSLCHTTYVTVISISGFLFRDYVWKGRNVR